MPRIKNKEASDQYRALCSQSREAGFRENKDCAVVAVAAVTGLPYAEAHAALKAAGRKDRRGTPMHVTRAALAALGFKVTEVPRQAIINHYPGRAKELKFITSHPPERFPKHWPAGRFLLSTFNHILAVVDGVNCDWSRGRSLRCRWVYMVERVTP